MKKLLHFFLLAIVSSSFSFSSIKEFNSKRKGDNVVTLDVFFDEEYAAGGKIEERILDSFEFAANAIESYEYKKKPFDIRMKINSIRFMESQDIFSVYSLLAQAKLLAEKESDVAIYFSHQKNKDVASGITDKESGYIVVNTKDNEEYIVLHEMLHLFGAADRNEFHPDYEEESIMSYKWAFSTKKLDEKNLEIITENANRKWDYGNEERERFFEITKKLDERKRKKIRDAYFMISSRYKLDEGIKILEEMKIPETKIFLGDAFYSKGCFERDNEKAEEYFEKAASYFEEGKKQNENWAAEGLSWTFLKLGKKEKALEAAKKTKSRSGKEAYIWALVENKKFDEAYEEIKKYQNKNFLDDEQYYLLGHILNNLGKKEEAKVTLEKAIKYEGGKNPLPYEELSEILEKEDIARAYFLAHFADKISYSDSFYIPIKTRNYEERKNLLLEKFLQKYEKEIEIGKFDKEKKFIASDLNNLAWNLSYEKKTRLEDALRYAKIANLLEKNAFYIDTLAWVLFMKGMKNEAIEKQKEAIKNLEREDFYRRLIIMLEANNQNYEGEIKKLAELKKSSEKNELEKTARYAVLDAKMHEIAKKIAEKALSLDKNDFHIKGTYGIILYELGNYEEAIKNLEYSLKMEKDKENKETIKEIKENSEYLEKAKEKLRKLREAPQQFSRQVLKSCYLYPFSGLFLRYLPRENFSEA